MSGYRTIVADPPWPYRGKWGSITHGGKGPSISKALAYPVMTLEEISALEVEAWAAPNAWLFLWTTSRFLRSSYDVMDAWGFAFSQTLVWRKTGNPSPLGGKIAPSHHEFLLVCRRGSPETLGRLKSSVIDAPAPVFGHSAKPEAFLDMVEQVSPGPYLEMFARRARFGWDYYGDESLGTAKLPGHA